MAMEQTSLPSIYQITPEPVQAPHYNQFLSALQATLQSGIRLVQFRAKKMRADEHRHLALQALEMCHKHGAKLVFNGPVNLAIEIGCDGVHLNSIALMSCASRPVPRNMLLSAACHDAAQIESAEELCVDFITLSPVLATKTHPEAHPLGWAAFSQLVSGRKIPVYALGGMCPEMISAARQAGACGIAAISSTWGGRFSVQ